MHLVHSTGGSSSGDTGHDTWKTCLANNPWGRPPTILRQHRIAKGREGRPPPPPPHPHVTRHMRRTCTHIWAIWGCIVNRQRLQPHLPARIVGWWCVARPHSPGSPPSRQVPSPEAERWTLTTYMQKNPCTTCTATAASFPHPVHGAHAPMPCAAQPGGRTTCSPNGHAHLAPGSRVRQTSKHAQRGGGAHEGRTKQLNGTCLKTHFVS